MSLASGCVSIACSACGAAGVDISTMSRKPLSSRLDTVASEAAVGGLLGRTGMDMRGARIRYSTVLYECTGDSWGRLALLSSDRCRSIDESSQLTTLRRTSYFDPRTLHLSPYTSPRSVWE